VAPFFAPTCDPSGAVGPYFFALMGCLLDGARRVGVMMRGVMLGALLGLTALWSVAPAGAQTISTQIADPGKTGTVGQYTSQAVVNGNLAISYYDGNNFDLKFARNSQPDGSGTWNTVTVDSTGSVGQ